MTMTDKDQMNEGLTPHQKSEDSTAELNELGRAVAAMQARLLEAMDGLGEQVGSLRIELGEVKTELSAVKTDVSSLSKKLKTMKKAEARLGHRLTDIDTELSAIRTFGVDSYRPGPMRTTATGRSVVEPVQSWRRKPGY